MRYGAGICYLTYIVYLFFSGLVSANQLPTSNIAVEFTTENAASPDQRNLLIPALENEMRLLGFMGRVRVLGPASPNPVSGETLIKITVSKNRWITKKLMSIPYFVNRYTREYIIESFVQVPSGRNGMAIKRLKAVSALPARAQYISNDKYDPALYPNQIERIETEESTRRLFAKRLAEHLLGQLR